MQAIQDWDGRLLPAHYSVIPTEWTSSSLSDMTFLICEAGRKKSIPPSILKKVFLKVRLHLLFIDLNLVTWSPPEIKEAKKYSLTETISSVEN